MQQRPVIPHENLGHLNTVMTNLSRGNRGLPGAAYGRQGRIFCRSMPPCAALCEVENVTH